MKKKKLLKVGEFARICRTTKDTLLHYDRKGLLKPKYIADNGYRVYGAEQYFDFDLISLLKEGGCTLEEIKKRRSDWEKYGYLDLLKEQVLFLQEKQTRLAHRLSKLKQLVAMTEESVAKPFDMIFFEERRAEIVYFYPVEPDKMLNRETSVECYSDYLLDNLTSGNTVDCPLGYVIPKEYAIGGNYRMCYLFRNIFETEHVNAKEIPCGRYACIFHRGDIDSHIDILNLMIDEISKMKLQILSDVYVYDQMSYILIDTNPDYVAKYIVKIG